MPVIRGMAGIVFVLDDLIRYDRQGGVMSDLIYSEHDLLGLLDELVADRGGDWWSGFYADRSKPCPFFVTAPDETLVDWAGSGRLGAGRALELGCGNGRNAIYLARNGFAVDAVDFSREAIDWAKENVTAADVNVTLHCRSIFDLEFTPGTYDLVYDTGCFHHIAPHRRRSYVEIVLRALRSGGAFGLVCFKSEAGSGFTDREVYERRSLGGGLGYSEAQLRAFWGAYLAEIEVLRSMRKADPASGAFGEDFLWALLGRRARS